MITISTVRGLEKVESWDDILSRPGYRKDVDPSSIKLREVIGSYRFSADVPCGLSTCHQPHRAGYLVLAEGGIETNVGHVCGDKQFGTDFAKIMPSVYQAAA